LGQLITNPRKPAESLQTSPLAITTTDFKDSSNQILSDVVFQKQVRKTLDLGFSARVLSLLPFGLSGENQHDSTHQYKIERVEERFFQPTPSYVRKSVCQTEVLAYLSKHKYRKSLFMIVGIKIGFNAHITHSKYKAFKSGGDATIPGVLTGIPVDLTGKFGFHSMGSCYEQKFLHDAFVFAYRLREVRYFKAQGLTTDTEYIKGAELHDLHAVRNYSRNVRLQEPIYTGVEDEIEIEGLALEDYEEDDFGSEVLDNCLLIRD
jgi:hypothetical protein